MFVLPGGFALLLALASFLGGAGGSPAVLPEVIAMPLRAVQPFVESVFHRQLQVSPPRSISQTRINVPTTGGTGSSFRDSRPLFGSSAASAARYRNALPRAPSPPPLVTSREVASGVVRRSVFGNYWGW